jgi:hypothetical protein
MLTSGYSSLSVVLKNLTKNRVSALFSSVQSNTSPTGKPMRRRNADKFRGPRGLNAGQNFCCCAVLLPHLEPCIVTEVLGFASLARRQKLW